MAHRISKVCDVIFDGWLPRVLVTHSDLPKCALSLLQQKCDVIITPGHQPSPKDILKDCKGVHGILWATTDRLDSKVIDAAGSQLKSVSVMTAGLDYVDIPALKSKKIKLGYTPKVVNTSTADIAVGLLIAAARRFYEGRLAIEKSEWNATPQWMLGQDLEGSTVGIVGLGNIGQAIAKRLRGFDIGRLLYSGRNEKPEAKSLNAEFVSFDHLVRDSDFVIIATPLTDETRGLFNSKVFDKMKPTSVLVNIARGKIVDTNDLVNALKEGKIFSAGLDVIDPEPVPADHELLKLPNCVIVPHLGTATRNAADDMALLAAQNVLLGLADQPLMAEVP